MENLNLQCCRQFSNSAGRGQAEQKLIIKAEAKRPQTAMDHTTKPQEPWTVFEGVYWI